MSQIEISGSSQNLKTLFTALALPRSAKSSGKGDNVEFKKRKVVIKKRPNGTGVLVARQSVNSVYSQVICDTNVETPFIKLSGEGDIVFNMNHTMRILKELAVYETIKIIHDTESNKTVFKGMKSDTDYEEWFTYSDSDKEIDDARNVICTSCNCTETPCPKCNGTKVVPSPALSYTNPIKYVPPDGTIYPKVDVQFEVDASVMVAVGDKTETLLDDTYPLQFNKNSLFISAGNLEDIASDSFNKNVPMTYILNNMPGKTIKLGSDFRNVFGSLDGIIRISAEDVEDPKDKSVYVTKTIMGFHTGIKIQAKLDDI